MFENRVLRKLFGPKRKEVRGYWRKIHNEDLRDVFNSLKNYSGNNIKDNEMGGSCGTYRVSRICIEGSGGDREKQF